MTAGYVSEIFCSNQGEGPLVGQRQVFLRTAGCTATCRWCDTVYSKVRSARCVIRGAEGEAARSVPNPMEARVAAGEVIEAARRDGTARTVSITGGEPLEQGEFVREVAARCRGAGLGVYLETNGLEDEALARTLSVVDVVAMDIKLPSATGMVSWKRHEACLAHAVEARSGPRGLDGGRGLFVKVVVDDRATRRELETAAALVAAVDPGIPFVLQPESGTMFSDRVTPDARRRLHRLLDEGREAAAAVLDDVRVIPQVHKVLGIR